MTCPLVLQANKNFIVSKPQSIRLVAVLKKRGRRLRPLAERAAQVLARLKRVRNLSVEEKSVHALGLAATPDERWEIFENFVRSAGYWRPWKKKRSGSS